MSDRANMPTTFIVAGGALVAAGLLIILMSEMRTEVIRPIAVNASNTSATGNALSDEAKMWPTAMVGGTIVLVAFGLIMGAKRSRPP